MGGGYFQIQNRRYLGNKFRLLCFIREVLKKCDRVETFCDIFAGTGVVGAGFNRNGVKIISNDFMISNYVCLKTFLDVNYDYEKSIREKIIYLNSLSWDEDNYFSDTFGGKYFTLRNARKIGKIREEIDVISELEERDILLCSLIYAVDRVANTTGHYEGYRKKLDTVKSVTLLMPDVMYDCNFGNEVYCEDANNLVRRIRCDVLYLDPPYNSRQYGYMYHLLNNLVEWKKPEVFGVARKMDSSLLKSEYCLSKAIRAFSDLVNSADCRYILVSYNNSEVSDSRRRRACMCVEDMLDVLRRRGEVKVFERRFNPYSSGTGFVRGNLEKVLFCKVN